MKKLLSMLGAMTLIGTTAGNLGDVLNLNTNITSSINTLNNKKSLNHLTKYNKLINDKQNKKIYFEYILKGLKAWFKDNDNFIINKNLYSLKYNTNKGVTKVKSWPWYYFSSYEQVYLSKNVAQETLSIEQQGNFAPIDMLNAIEYMLTTLGFAGYYWYAAFVGASLETFIPMWLTFNPPSFNTGNGIFWGQTYGNVFTGVWSQ